MAGGRTNSGAGGTLEFNTTAQNSPVNSKDYTFNVTKGVTYILLTITGEANRPPSVTIEGGQVIAELIKTGSLPATGMTIGRVVVKAESTQLVCHVPAAYAYFVFALL